MPLLCQREEAMRAILIAAVVAALPAAAFAQQTRAYVSGVGGFATTGDEGTSGTVLGEAGFKVAPHLFVFGNIGRFNNLLPSEVQPALNDATQALSTLGVDVTGNPKVPAWY